MSNHPGSRARVSEALYLLTSQTKAQAAPTSAAPFRTPPRLFDMLIVAVGRFELAREQKLSEDEPWDHCMIAM